MFSRRLLEQSSSVAMTQAKKLIAKIDKFCETGEPFDLQKCYYAFTMDTFAYIAFGIDFDSQTKTHKFSSAFDRCQFLCQERLIHPFWEIQRAFQLSAAEREIRENAKVIREFAMDVIKSKRRALNSGEELGPDLISRFLTTAKKKGERISDDELISIVNNFIIAGRDTTAAALTWTTMELMRKPAMIEKCLDEVRTRVSNQHGGLPLQEVGRTDAFNAIYNGLPYLKATLSEGLRLHPSVPKNMKFAINDDTLPDGTKVKAGTAIIWSPYMMGRQPQLWEKPLEYIPERWMKRDPSTSAIKKEGKGEALYATAGAALGVTDFMNPVFNCGPRNCIGRPLAYMEMQLMLAVLLWVILQRPFLSPADMLRRSALPL